MDLLVVEPLDPEVLDWLSMRHAVVYAPHLAHDPREFRAALGRVRGVVLPPSVAVDRAVLRAAPYLLTGESECVRGDEANPYVSIHTRHC